MLSVDSCDFIGAGLFLASEATVLTWSLAGGNLESSAVRDVFGMLASALGLPCCSVELRSVFCGVIDSGSGDLGVTFFSEGAETGKTGPLKLLPINTPIKSAAR